MKYIKPGVSTWLGGGGVLGTWRATWSAAGEMALHERESNECDGEIDEFNVHGESRGTHVRLRISIWYGAIGSGTPADQPAANARSGHG
jgi:hypothetical protein